MWLLVDKTEYRKDKELASQQGCVGNRPTRIGRGRENKSSIWGLNMFVAGYRLGYRLDTNELD